MPQTDKHPTTAELRHLSSLHEASAEKLQSLSEQLEVYSAPKGTRLLERGSQDPSLLYLLHGSVQLKAADGGQKLISHNDPSALSPLARLRPSRYEVIASTPINFLRIDADIIDELDSSLENSSSLLLDSYEVDENTEFNELDPENHLMVQIYEDLSNNQLLLPSLPDIAIRIGQAVNHDFADAGRVARVLENDPAIAAKIVRVANSARYAGSQPINRLPDAVARIGLNTTHQLVITFALRELFRCNSVLLNQHMQKLWQHSCQVASIAHVLAEHCPRLDPQIALLAGLVHEVGSLTVISYACDFPDVLENRDILDATIHHLKGQLGNMILQKWKLPKELSLIPGESENWTRSHSKPCDYIDLIIIANRHALIHDPISDELLPIDQLPAYKKLGFGDDPVHSSYTILQKAEEELRDTQSLLGDS